MKYAKTLLNISVIGIVAAVSGCAHSTMRGTVAMKVSDQEAHVCMGDNEVKAGDKVALFKNECTGTNSGHRGDSSRTCTKIKLGEGSVEKTLNEHYSLIKVNSGVPFSEGTVVEKL